MYGTGCMCAIEVLALKMRVKLSAGVDILQFNNAEVLDVFSALSEI